MNHLKTNPVGKDASIQRLQYHLYENLIAKWSVPLDGYGRCYIVSTKGVKTIEPYIGGNEYENLVVAEKNKFFFTAENEEIRTGNLTFKTSVDLYFILDVNKIYPDISHRADEEVRKDVINIIESVHGVLITRIAVNIEKVFNRYEYDYQDDMQPYHCFKIELDLIDYDINQNYCIN